MFFRDIMVVWNRTDMNRDMVVITVGKVGRPSKYEEVKDHLLRVQGWARDGLSDEQIAENLGIAVGTLYEWKNRYPEFREAMKKGKEIVDREVENALLKRAMGYEYEEVVIENGVETKRVKKIVPPDTTAQIFWLKNRKPQEWRDRQEREITATVSIENLLSQLDQDE